MSTLFAAAGTAGPGNISIASGVAAPITLNIGNLSATNAAGGAITLTNNGTINDTINGITATNSIVIDAFGATSDFNTGSGAGITSNTGAIVNGGTGIGEDTNLGDGVGGGSMTAATGISWLTGRNFTMNANATVTDTTSGNIIITAGDNFTMLTSPGSVANAPEIVNNAPGGIISLSALSGQLTLNSTGATAVRSNNGSIFLAGDAMVIGAAINSGTAATELHNCSAGQAITLGGANAPGVLGLTQGELNEITAAVTRIGTNSASGIRIASPITNPTNSSTLALIANSSISQTPFGSLSAVNLRVDTGGTVTLNNPNNNIQVIAGSAPNAVTVVDGTHNLTVGVVDGDTGIDTTNSAINLTADSMNITQQVNSGTGIVTLSAFSASQQVALGTGNVAGTLGLTDAELADITASVLRIDPGASAGINVTGAITRHAGYNTLSVTAAVGIGQTAALSVANLALVTDNGINLANSGNSVDTLAFANFSNIVDFVNGSNNPLTIGAVDGLTSSSNAGTTTTISTGRNLAFATGLSSAGATALISTIGRILDGAGGAIVDVTAPSLALSASTGIGTSAGPLQTQVGTLSAVTSTGRIFINNDRAVPGTLNIGSGGLRVTGASGDVVLTNNGTINVLNTNDVIVGPGNITIQAQGANADINTGGQTSQLAIRSQGPGLVNVAAGRDITLGNSAGFGDVRSDSGSVAVSAGRNITINSNTFIDVGSGTGTVTVAAGGNLTMTSAQPDEIFTAGGDIALSTGAGATMTLGSTGTAVLSNGGNISLTADTLNINQGVNAGTGNVLIQPATAGQPISLGTATGGLSLTSTEFNLVTASNLTIGNANAGAVTLGGTVKPTKVTNLTITTGSNFTATAGSGLGATGGTVTINFGQNGLGATADLTNVTFSSASFVIGGAGNDTFIPNVASISTFTGGAGDDTFRGTASQLTLDTITDISGGDRIVVTDGNPAHFSFSLNGTVLSFDPDTSVSSTSETLNLSNAPNGHCFGRSGGRCRSHLHIA